MTTPRLTRLLFHTIADTKFDVGAIVKASGRARNFVLSHGDKPYYLMIEHVSPWVRTSSMTIDGNTTTFRSEEWTLKAKFPVTREEADLHLREIKAKQARLERIEEKERQRLLALSE